MAHEIGRLQAYLDGALSSAEQADLNRHLEGCQACREELRVLRESMGATHHRLTTLEPPADVVPEPAQALARMQAAVMKPAEADASPAPARVGPWQAVKRRFATMRQSSGDGGFWRRLSPPRRLAVAGTLVLAIVVILFSIAPTRDAMAQFLGLFRVRKFAVVTVDQAQLDRLESLEDILESSSLADPTYLREPGEPEPLSLIHI
jgi:anti-sigma factor RsiW